VVDWPTAPPSSPAAPGLQVGGAAYPTRPPEQWPAHAPVGPGPAGGGPPGSGPVPPPGDDSDRTWPVVVTAVAVVAVLALVIVGVGTFISASDGADDDATDTTVDLSDPAITAPPSEEPIDPTMPSIPGLDPGSGVDPTERAQPLEDVLPDIIEFVEETRGQQFVTEPVVEAVPDDEFEQLLAEVRDEEQAEAEARGDGPEALAVASIALGLLPPGFDLESATEDLEANFVFGFYDPDTDELYVKGEQVTPFVQSVVAHELTHALDDQVFDLARLDALLEQPDEEAFAFQALVEGTASFVQAAFEAQMSPEDAEALEAEQYQLGLDQLPAAMGLPASLLVGSQVPYASGERFVDALVAEEGTAGIDAAYEAPPATGEQLLDPERFAADEEAVALRPLEAPDGVEVADEGAFGAVDLRMLDLVSDPLSPLIDPDLGTLDPVPGYGGGQFVSWTEGGRSCISLEAVGDDAAGSSTIQEALETWADFVPGAEVSSRVGGSGIPVITATSCA
jgi:hypothetical protein